MHLMAESISKGYRGRKVVDQVSLSVEAGNIVGLLGPNGAGKTTTFRMLCGLLPASSGTLEVAGMNLRTARAQARVPSSGASLAGSGPPWLPVWRTSWASI